jgi:hypothetical protein
MKLTLGQVISTETLQNILLVSPQELRDVLGECKEAVGYTAAYAIRPDVDHMAQTLKELLEQTNPEDLRANQPFWYREIRRLKRRSKGPTSKSMLESAMLAVERLDPAVRIRQLCGTDIELPDELVEQRGYEMLEAMMTS